MKFASIISGKKNFSCKLNNKSYYTLAVNYAAKVIEEISNSESKALDTDQVTRVFRSS